MLDVDRKRAMAFDVDLVVGRFGVDSGEFGGFGGWLSVEGKGLLLLLVHLFE
jgi:hypothetical protein